MSDVSPFPLTWPVTRPRTRAREFGRWSRELSIARGFDELLTELNRLGARSIVISSNLRLRNDGLPYADQRQPDDPGVAAYFTRAGIPYVLACDRWVRVQHNAWAIARHIEAMRGMERWGVGDLQQALGGFRKLLAPPQVTRPWHEVLGISQWSSLVTIEARYRELAQAHHPDRGGDAARMAEINRALAEAREEKGGAL